MRRKQSWDKSTRLLARQAEKKFSVAAVRIALMTIPLSHPQAIFLGDDDRYKYQVQNWAKNTNWIIGYSEELGDFIKIPKSYELWSRLAGNVAEDFF